MCGRGGLRSNSIAFPQATAHVCGSNELPPPKDAAAAFMRESFIIALAGVDVEDLHKSKWAEVRRTPYVDAAEFLTLHDQFYHGIVKVNRDRATTDLQESGSTTEAVLQQAVKIEVAGQLPHRMEGPADTGCGGVHEECVVAVDGEVVVSRRMRFSDPQLSGSARLLDHISDECTNCTGSDWTPAAPE